ncbi:MAG: ATP-binding cassette domain-containing protein [Burkholderiales bacterium]|jgi:oligopeptide/dipeptide ABC transporter ATP-binding protein|nr:ATP-binding cassette domain-containing protein [Burkholderiales bacterium]
MTGALLSCRDLAVEFPSGGRTLRAVDGVDLDVEPGQTVAIVGESGCGKSTLARAIMGLNSPSRGSIRLEGRELVGLSQRELRPLRPAVQMVFQNPYGSLNPRLTVGRIIEEPMSVQGIGTRESRRERVRELLSMVGLAAGAERQYPHEFSGGQRQRIAIARALALDPKLIVCDEPVSALDVSVQAQVLNLLVRLQKELGVSYLFISHDLSVVRHLAHRTVVMYLGRVVAQSSSRSFWNAPLHPYVAALKQATPTMDVLDAGYVPPPVLEGEIPSALNPPPGCRFSSRCPHVLPLCRESYPALRQVSATESVACHRVEVHSDGSASTPWGVVSMPATAPQSAASPPSPLARVA